MERLSPELRTIYAELLDRLTAGWGDGLLGDAQGTFATRVVKGIRCWYFQHPDPGGAGRQLYLGRSEPGLDAVIEGLRAARAGGEESRAATRRLCAQLKSGGAAEQDAASTAVIRALADAGVFHLGGALLGTHAFIAIGTMLGVRWPSTVQRAKDVEVCASRLALAVPDLQTEPPPALDCLRTGFLPLPPLERDSPATTFSVRGRDLRVDLLTPAPEGGMGLPFVIRRLNASASPAPYLDYLLEECVPAAVPDTDGILIRVPRPGRFVLHKLLVAPERPAVYHTRKEQDLRQAGMVLRLLDAEHPDELSLAVDAVRDRGRRWLGVARKGLADLARIDPGIAGHLSL